jgi:hypothetical protein
MQWEAMKATQWKRYKRVQWIVQLLTIRAVLEEARLPQQPPFNEIACTQIKERID